MRLKSEAGSGGKVEAGVGVTAVRMSPIAGVRVNRKVNSEGETQEASAQLEASIQGKRGSGQPLDESVREPMEREFGADFSGVRVHTDGKADELNQAIQAKAFTTGEDIFFREGAYEPGSKGGQELLAHELTHVVQQKGEAVQYPQRQTIIQRVGGTKVGIKREEGISLDDAAVVKLKDIFSVYKGELKQAKEQAKQNFKGKEKDIQSQTSYTQALSRSEINIDHLKQRINATTELSVGTDNIVKKKSDYTPIARILSGNDAYKPISQAQEGRQALYKKYALDGVDGLSKTDYIKVQNRMLRRYAYRGITPMEIAQIEAGGMVTPWHHTDQERGAQQVGMHFEDGVGRRRQMLAGKSDLSYIKQFAKVTEITPEMYAFAHARKGVSKFFSFRSTPGDITSNHGASFSGSGEIKVDLAKVSEGDFVFHYADSGAHNLQSGIQKSQIKDQERHDSEVQRTRESLLRNREIILKQYPASAFVEYTKQPNIPDDAIRNQGYQNGHKNIRADFVLQSKQAVYNQGYARGMNQAGYNHGSRDGEKGGGKKYYQRNNTDYKQGYDQGYSTSRGKVHGYKDGYNGKTKNYLEYNQYYIDAYNEGYEKGIMNAPSRKRRRY